MGVLHKPVPLFLVHVQHLLKGAGKIFRIIRFRDQSVFPVPDDLREGRDVRNHRGQLRCQAFQQGDAESLFPGGHDKDIGSPEPRAHVRNELFRQQQVVPDAQLAGHFQVGFPLVPAAPDQCQAQLLPPGTQFRESPEQYIKPLPVDIDPHTGDQNLIVRDVEQIPGFVAVVFAAGKTDRIRGIVDHVDPGRRQAFLFGHVLLQPAGAGDVPVNIFIIFCFPRFIKGRHDRNPQFGTPGSRNAGGGQQPGMDDVRGQFFHNAGETRRKQGQRRSKGPPCPDGDPVLPGKALQIVPGPAEERLFNTQAGKGFHMGNVGHAPGKGRAVNIM